MKKKVITLPTGRKLPTHTLIRRGIRYGRTMRRAIWRKHFPGLEWSQYLEMEQHVKEATKKKMRKMRKDP